VAALSPEGPQGAEARSVTLAEIEARSIPEPNTGCWLWLGPTMGRREFPYGRVRLNGRIEGAHRVALRLTVGPPPSMYESWALHSCDQPLCVNPAHLRWGSAQANAEDRSLRQRGGGPGYGEDHHSWAGGTIESRLEGHRRVQAGEDAFTVALSLGLKPHHVTSAARYCEDQTCPCWVRRREREARDRELWGDDEDGP
jgi:hypothetical protein